MWDILDPITEMEESSSHCYLYKGDNEPQIRNIYLPWTVGRKKN